MPVASFSSILNHKSLLQRLDILHPRSPITHAVRASVFNNNVLGFYIAQITQALSEFLNARGGAESGQ
jgi:hypothetical protein